MVLYVERNSALPQPTRIWNLAYHPFGYILRRHNFPWKAAIIPHLLDESQGRSQSSRFADFFDLPPSSRLSIESVEA
jgi:hypothetical protein